jgi:hypothetical protein
MTSEQKLWQSVILTAVYDATSKSKKKCKYTDQYKDDAKKWLLNNNHWYFTVCNMADIDGDTLRSRLKTKFHQTNLEC